MRHRRRVPVLAAATVVAATAAPLVAGSGPAARAATPPPYTAQILHFSVHVGPGGAQACDVLGELFTPAGASPTHRVPSILTTNGFGGSYTDQVGLAEAFASRGYAVLAYSGLGFGGSGCKIYLDDPLYDGMAASQLVSFLGGAPGIGYTDAAHTVAAAPVDYVIHDPVDHAGRADRYDPRVGMIGGSYGGEIQFAAADVDPRIDTIVPFITWNDLSYSLAPNDAGYPTPAGSDPPPGATKSTWAGGFSADGMADGITGAQADPGRDVGCPNFADWVCPALAEAGSAGYPGPDTVAHLRNVSVASYMTRIRIPTLLIQGENDTLFNLNEAVATFRALRAQRTPVKMIWQSWGHSGSTPAPGELDLSAPNPATQYETARLAAWFGHYLAGEAVSTGPLFAYFRDWVPYSGIATPAYGTSATFPVGRTVPYYLSAGATLGTDPALIGVSDQVFVTGPGGAPTGTAPPDAVGGSAPPERDAPATSASWTSAPLTAPLDVVGSPVLHVALISPAAAAPESAGPAGDLVVFAKVLDVAPDGTAQLVHGLVAPARVADVDAPVTITLPGIVHRFAPGHRIEVVLAGGDVNYRGGLVPEAVDVRTGSTGQVLDLPVVGS